MSLVDKDAITNLYTSCSSAGDIAQNAYTTALATFQKELGNSSKAAWLTKQANISDVLSEVEIQRNTHNTTNTKWTKVSGWLDSIASRVIYYSGVLDALAQHHPEYVSLAWGAIKFVLTGIINHSELLHKFHSAFIDIAEALKVASCSALLYGTSEMEEVIAQLYLQIMRFLEKAVKWFNRHPVMQMLSAIVKPYALSWKEVVEEIHCCVTRIRERVNGAIGAEVRDTHIAVLDTKSLVKAQEARMQGISLALVDLQSEYVGMRKMVEYSLQEVLNIKTLSVRLTEDMAHVRPGVRDIQGSTILQGLSPPTDPETTLLNTQISIKQNRFPHDHLRNQSHLRRCVEQWFAQQSSSLLILRANAKAKVLVKTIIVDLVQALRNSSLPVFFALPEVNNRISGDHTATLETWLKDLVFQALRANPDFLVQDPEKLQAAKYFSAHSPGEWMGSLSQMFALMPSCFLILDTEALYEQYKDDSQALNNLIDLFRKLIESVQATGKSLKIVLVTYGSTLPVNSATVPSRFLELFCSLHYQAIPPKLRARYTQANRTRRTYLQRLGRAI